MISPAPFCPISSFNLPTSDVFFTCSQLKRAGAGRRSLGFFYIHQLDSARGCSSCVVFAQSLRERTRGIATRESAHSRTGWRTGWCEREREACVRAGERPKQTHVVHLKKSLTYRFCSPLPRRVQLNVNQSSTPDSPFGRLCWRGVALF